MSYFDRTHYDGKYEVGRPQLQAKVQSKDQFKLYPYYADNSVLDHIKQAGMFLLMLEPQTNLPVHAQTMSSFAAGIILQLNVWSSKYFKQVGQNARVKQQQFGYWEHKNVSSVQRGIDTDLEPPFRFGISLFGTEQEPWAQFRGEEEVLII